MKTLRYYFFLLLFGCSSTAFSQSIDFLQWSSAPLYFNPAYAGSTTDTRFSAMYLQDWVGLPGAHHDSYLSYDQLSNKLKGGIGVELRTAYANDWNENRIVDHSASITYAMKIALGNSWTISPALKLSYQYNNGFWASGRIGPYFTSEPNNRGNLNLMPGLLLNSPKFYFGVSVDNLRLVAFSDNSKLIDPLRKVPTRLNLQSGYSIQPQTGKWSLSFSAMTNFENRLWEVRAQSLFRVRKVLVGAGYAHDWDDWFGTFSNSNDYFFSLGFKTERFKVLASYNIATSRFTNFPGSNSAEIALNIYFPRKMVSTGMAGI